MPMIFDHEKCDGCAICSTVCPGDVIRMGPGKGRNRRPFNVFADECWHCGACRQDCEQQAINVVFPPEMLCI